ncbi:MAG: urease accessory protein UreF [Acidimicrobiales bacterium]
MARTTATGSTVELLLADGRFPGGGFAHSGGLEAAVSERAVFDVTTLAAFAEGRLWACGPLEGWLAAQACRAAHHDPDHDADHDHDHDPDPELHPDQVRLAWLEAEAEAHQPSSALRAASRAQGRGLRRAAAVLFPQLDLGPIEVLTVVTGVVAAAAGLSPQAAARLAVWGSLMSTVSAAPKLMALDMIDATAIALRLAPSVDRISEAASASADLAPPISSAPMMELRAQRHVTWEVRLFAS